MASLFTRRVIAYVLDFFVVSAFMWIVSYLCYLVNTPTGIHDVYQVFPFIVPILIMVYFSVLEKIQGATVGKALMYLKVRSRNGAMITWPQAIVRNLTKIYWIPIIFDWAVGRILKHDRILAKITRTVVVDELN